MQVACPSCSAEYPVDERRLPASGLKMRCPKCGSRFHVHPDGHVDAANSDKPAAPPKPPPAPSGGGLGRPVPPPPKPNPPAARAVPAPTPAGGLDIDFDDLPAPAPAKKKPLAPAFDVAAPAAAGGLDLDLDLPAPTPAKKPLAPAFGPNRGADRGDLDLDLPAPARPKKPLAPAFSPSPPAAEGDYVDLDLSDDDEGGLDLDLPAPKAASPAPDLGLDLPAPKAGAGARRAPDFDLDLPAPKATGANLPKPFGGSADLPKPFAGGGLADLPASRAGGADLPAPRAALAHGGTPFDDLDLPGPSGADLPGPALDAPSLLQQADEAFGDLDLPMPRTQASAATDFGDLELPIPKAQSAGPAAAAADAFGDLELPVPKTEDFGDLSLPTPSAASLPAPSPAPMPAAPPASSESASLGVDFGIDGDFDDLALPEPRMPVAAAGAAADEAMRDAAGRSGLGGTAFGELDLGGGGGGDADDMEFADLPQEAGEPAAGDSLPPPKLAVPKKAAADKPAPRPRKKRNTILYVAITLALLLAAGAGLGFTPYGLFGINLIEPFLPGAGDPAQIRALITSAEETAASDRWVDVRAAVVELGRARHNAGLNRQLLARSLVHESLYVHRFGDDMGSAARCSAIRLRMSERGMEGGDAALAFAADALRQGQGPAARNQIRLARSAAPNDPYVDLVLGEVELVEGELEAAAEAFQAAADHGGGGRALWGLARVRLAGTDSDAARAAVDAVLEASPHHGEAMVAKAELLRAAGQQEDALALAEQAAGRRPVDGESLRSSAQAVAGALSVIGAIRETNGLVTAALEAYDAALAADDSHVAALLGAGRVLLGDRPGDALARFESVMQSQTADRVQLPSGRNASQEARLGAGRALLALQRIQEANTLLEALAVERDRDGEVLLWLGKANEALDPPNYESAEQNYRAAITETPQMFAAYLALAELFLVTERGSDAGVFLERAEAVVPETAEMRYQLGAFELRRNRPAQAIRALRRALELSPDHPPALFSLAVAQRRSGDLDGATVTFDRLTAADSGYPGLSLERGLLFEARGESERAADSYARALELDPDNMDLVLRLGAAQVSAGRIDDAEVTLDRVRTERPNSPEANHFIGRVAFARHQFSEALTYFRRAVQLDPSRGEFHLYAGWAALENGQLGEALHGVDEAIRRDQGLGDAYWIRGVVRLRSGHPSDALADLTRALQLKPSRIEAYAALGDTYDQLSRLNDAIQSYQRAVEHDDSNGLWWYRLGRLRMDRGARAEAATALQRATLLGDAATPVPGWLADAHRLRGEALRLGGSPRESVRHYQRYLELAPASAIDRDQVRSLLMDMGVVPE